MSKEKAIEMTGEVVNVLPNATFEIAFDNGHEALCHISGKIRKNNIRIILGDTVTVELSPYDLERGRIVYRGKKEEDTSSDE